MSMFWGKIITASCLMHKITGYNIQTAKIVHLSQQKGSMLIGKYTYSMSSNEEHLIYRGTYDRKGKYIPLSYPITNGFRAAPLQENLFNTTGTGHSKTLRALQFRLGIPRPIHEKSNSLYDKMSFISGTEDMAQDEMENTLLGRL